VIRRLIAVIAVIAAPAVSGAQSDAMTSSFNINGLRVIVRRNTANEVVTANVYLLGGTQQLTPATQGMEALLLAAGERGSRHYPKESARQALAALGGDFAIDPSEDWTRFGFTTIRAAFDSTWTIFADQLTAPTLDSNEVELVRARMISDVREADNSPDPLLNRLADSLEFLGHPYGFSPTGTESALRSISLAALRNYQATQMVTSRMLLVVVGNIERAHVEQLVERTLARLPQGTYVWSPPRTPAKQERALVVRQAALPTNYIMGYFAGPPARDADYQALRVASAVLSGRFFTEIRSRRNLSYEVDAPFFDRAIASGGVYVTTTDPNQTLTVMRTELDRLQRELIDAQGLDRLTQQFITDYFLKNETNADQATFLARAQIYLGDYRAADHFVEELRRVRPDDVRRVARQYMQNFRFVYLGKPESLSRALVNQF
jgi:zinc protease